MKWFKNLKMIQKLVSSFIIIAAFIGIVGFASLYSMSNINKNINNIYETNLIGIHDVDMINANKGRYVVNS